jgi:glycosyltransferase involved in cell wall biosynthesis
MPGAMSRPEADSTRSSRLISVVIPARNAARGIGDLVRSVLAQRPDDREVEVIVVDDASTDDTAAKARAAGARVLALAAGTNTGNPALARNRGAAHSSGDPIVFLDADCTPQPQWLDRLLRAHAAGADVVGGSLDMPPGLPAMARCDYYCGWYHVHSRRKAGDVPNHPPGNLSVRRDVFTRSGGFTEQQPIAYAHEELAWQAEVRRAGGRIVFEPTAIVHHSNRPGFGNLLRRNYRWGYSAIESKARSGAARHAWVYRYPSLLVLGSVPLAVATTAYIVGCWVRAKMLEPLVMVPAVLAARLAYSTGLVAGGIRWMRHGETALATRPRWE